LLGLFLRRLVFGQPGEGESIVLKATEAGRQVKRYLRPGVATTTIRRTSLMQTFCENPEAADWTTRVRGRAPLGAPRTALVHRSVAAAEYITDPMMQLITSGNVQSESMSWLFIPTPEGRH
jgi:hypothetical protein